MFEPLLGLKRQRTEDGDGDPMPYDARKARAEQEATYNWQTRQGPTPLYYFLNWKHSDGFSSLGAASGNYNTFKWILPEKVVGYEKMSIVDLFMSNSYSTANPVMSKLGLDIKEIGNIPTRTSMDNNVGTGLNPLTISGRVPPTFMLPNHTWVNTGAFAGTALWTYVDDGNDTFQCTLPSPNLNTITVTLTDENLLPLGVNAAVTGGASPYYFNMTVKFF